jgi:hypothetical protein
MESRRQSRINEVILLLLLTSLLEIELPCFFGGRELLIIKPLAFVLLATIYMYSFRARSLALIST